MHELNKDKSAAESTAEEGKDLKEMTKTKEKKMGQKRKKQKKKKKKKKRKRERNRRKADITAVWFYFISEARGILMDGPIFADGF